MIMIIDILSLLSIVQPWKGQKNPLEKSGQLLRVFSSLLLKSGHTQDEISLPRVHSQNATVTKQGKATNFAILAVNGLKR